MGFSYDSTYCSVQSDRRLIDSPQHSESLFLEPEQSANIRYRRQADSKAMPKPDSKAKPKPEPKPMPKSDSKPMPKPESKPMPKPESKPMPKSDSKPMPDDPKAMPDANSKPMPNADEKPCPKNKPIIKKAFVKCSTSGCVVQCSKNYQFKNGQSSAKLLCNNGVWTLDGFEKKAKPACKRKIKKKKMRTHEWEIKKKLNLNFYRCSKEEE